ncbi:MAG: hypothetical protein KIA08_14665 [Clostridium baratii]|uniref:hypothetical protein n=1 Tax=Clostridium baratii TaxID=1561 RepID=UPI00242D930A|nr:hypothetical protein [Clostridium baratii]MBS6043912.1 hypothetical protein [Clostridium baratii]
MIQEERVLNRFLEYVKIPSESKNEKDFADKLEEDLKKLGLEVIRDKAYEAAGKISFADAHYRKDIAWRALKK